METPNRLRNLTARLRSAEHSYMSCRLNPAAPRAWVEDFRKQIDRLERLISEEQTTGRQ